MGGVCSTPRYWCRVCVSSTAGRRDVLVPVEVRSSTPVAATSWRGSRWSSTAGGRFGVLVRVGADLDGGCFGVLVPVEVRSSTAGRFGVLVRVGAVLDGGCFGVLVPVSAALAAC